MKLRVGRTEVNVSNPDKVFFPDRGVKKIDLVEYYVDLMERRYGEALQVLERVAAVDPEDLQMHYTAMLAARGAGDTERAAREERLFLRFKAEEASQALTARQRMLSPEDNNERQQIHEHESVALGPTGGPPSPGPGRPPGRAKTLTTGGGASR